ncbi:MAG: hypothetical protein KIS78_14705 [Labilithrix sp.]|nr:hypothetical protein [Labilithrix sp.]MCW5833650.1 hypothetical protein [Labilithrix sp.]
MNDILASVVVFFFAALGLALVARRYTKLEQRLLALAFGAHLLAALGQIATAKGIYQGGDNLTYMTEGSLLARAIELDPGRFGRLWLNVLFQRETGEALTVLGEGDATGTMVALAAGLALLFRYSLFGVSLSIAFFAFFGKLALYRVFRELLPSSTRARVSIAVLLMPSAVFWSAGIQKEAVVMGGIGPVCLGVHRLLRGRPFLGVTLFALGAVPVALVKPYTLFALTVAVGAWIGVDRLQARMGGSGAVRIRPLYLVLAAALVYGGVIALGQLYPMYSMDNLGKDLARHQGLGVATGGGSYYTMGDEEAMSFGKQLAFAPLAVATALFRPFPFEANNALAFGASLEALVLTIFVVQGLARSGLRGAVTTVMSTPVLFAAIVFSLTFGMGVGLATTNFGSLSRYRMPLIPFYATAVLVLSAPKIRAAVSSVKRAPSATRPAALSGRAVRARVAGHARARLQGPARGRG